MPQPGSFYLATATAAYALTFAGLQRSPLLPGPKLFFQAISLALVAAAAARLLASH